MTDITLQQVKSVCGGYTSKSGSEYKFQCPICSQEGHDRKKDNLSYSESKKIVKCFYNDNHTIEVLAMINKKTKTNKEEIPKSITQEIWVDRQDRYLELMTKWNAELLQNERILNFLYLSRRLTPKTLDICGVGYDKEKDVITIPIFGLRAKGAIVDFELRNVEEKKIRRMGGGSSTIATVYGKEKAETLYICEGFIDGMCLVQWLLESGQKDFAVYSCSHGVNSLLNRMPEINFANFKQIKLMLDNDSAGDRATAEILIEYPFIKDSREFLKRHNKKDVCEYYKAKKKPSEKHFNDNRI